MIRLSKIIGLAIGPKSLLLAEVATKPASLPVIQKLAEFPYPEGLSPATPMELGQALAPFLRAQGFTVKDVIIGLPARRLLTRRKEVPPVSESVASATLRLQAETEFAAEADPFTIDYAGQTNSSVATAVMLIATAQSGIDQCNELAKAAGLKLRGITATSVALGRATSALPGGDGLVITLASGAAELVVQHGKSAAQLRHLAVANAGTPESIGSLVGEIRRTIASLHQNGTPLTLALWDDAAGDSGAAGSLLRERLTMPVSFPELRSIAVSESSEPNARGGAFAPAVAVALSALDADGPPVDFLHSRLAPPKVRSNKRPILIGAIIGVVVLLAAIAGYVDLQLKQATVDNLTAQHNAHAGEIKVAQTGYDRLREAQKWTQRKIRYVACLRDITNLFPDGSNTIWVTKFTLSEDTKGTYSGTLTGMASSETEVRALMKKMLAGKQFVNPHRENTQSSNAARRTGVADFLFLIKFDDYKPTEKP